MHQVTIGANLPYGRPHVKYGAPFISDGVFIGTGAKILGPIRVGTNVLIGANVVIYRDVPANTMVRPPKAELQTLTMQEPIQ